VQPSQTSITSKHTMRRNMITSQVRYQHAVRTANRAESGCRGERPPSRQPVASVCQVHRQKRAFRSYCGLSLEAPVLEMPLFAAFRITGNPSLPEPITTILAFGDSASFSVASIPFQTMILSVSPLLIVA
jgi:hypothetical protein